MEPRDQVLHLAVGPLNELAHVQNRSFTQPRPRMGADSEPFTEEMVSREHLRT